jgi:hypothetical protein
MRAVMMMTVLVEESPEQVTARLQRELAHVNEQCRTAHAMAMDWRQRCLAAEGRVQRLERKYRNLKRRKGLEHVDETGGDPEQADEAWPSPAVW